METATLKVKDLDIICVIGCGEAERTANQKITLDLDLEYDISEAALSDDINKAVNYVDIVRRLSEVCQEKKFRLVERLGSECCQMIFEEWPRVQKVKLEVRKTRIVPMAGSVGLVIEKVRG
jgi:dihydroneopterin aldolase